MSLAAGTAFTGDCCATQGAVLNEGGSVDIPSGSRKTAVSFNGVGYSATGGNTTIGSGQTLSLLGGADSALASTALAGGTLKLADPVRLSEDGDDLEDVGASDARREPGRCLQRPASGLVPRWPEAAV